MCRHKCFIDAIVRDREVQHISFSIHICISCILRHKTRHCTYVHLDNCILSRHRQSESVCAEPALLGLLISVVPVCVGLVNIF